MLIPRDHELAVEVEVVSLLTSLFLILHRKLFIAYRLDKRIRTRMPVLRSKYPDLQIPDNISWPDFVLSKFDNYGDRTAIVRFFLWWIITYLSFRFSWFHIPKVDFRSQVSKNPVNKYVAEYSALVIKYLPVYDAHFFSIKISIKIAVRIIHGFNCLSSTS